MTFATLSNVQSMMKLDVQTDLIVSSVLCIIPAIFIAVVNGALLRQLKRLLKNDQFSSATDEIKKALFKVGLTNLISFIFVGCQVAFVVWVGLEIVSWFSFAFYQKFT